MFFKKISRRKRFDRKVLRKNDISLLILDERWNGLFTSVQKSPKITKCEEELKHLLKAQARLLEEEKKNTPMKKKYMNRIMELTTKVYDDNDEKARKEMEYCEKEIKRINQREEIIKEELERIPDLIREKNLVLLEYTVNMVYFKIKDSQKRIEQLDRLIEKTREQLKCYIDEKESLSQGGTDVYSYFHDLLGREELEQLDREYFKMNDSGGK